MADSFDFDCPSLLRFVVSFRGQFLQWLDPVSLFVFFFFVSPCLNCGCFSCCNFLYISVLVMKSFTFLSWGSEIVNPLYLFSQLLLFELRFVFSSCYFYLTFVSHLNCSWSYRTHKLICDQNVNDRNFCKFVLQ